MTVAVVDVGVDLDHEDLAGGTDPARSHAYCGADSAAFDPGTDHGTAVAGLIAARDNAIGVRGVAPRALLYNRRLLACRPGNTSANVADAMTRDMTEVAVNNNSWGRPDAANAEPIFATDTTTREVAENTAAGQPLGSAVNATDADSGATLTYQIGGTDASHFDLDTSTGQLSAKSSLDREDRPSYSVSVGVSDGLDSLASADPSVDDWIAVDITVTDVDEPFTLACEADARVGDDWAFAEPLVDPDDETGTQQAVDPLRPPPPVSSELRVGSCQVSDPEGEPATWSRSGPDEVRFKISGDGVVGFSEAPDFEHPADVGGVVGDNRYEVTVEADAGGHSETMALTVEVTGVDEPPAVSGPAAITVREDGDLKLGSYSAIDPEGETVTLSPSGDDDMEFELAADGALSFRAAPAASAWTARSTTRASSSTASTSWPTTGCSKAASQLS